MNDLALLLHLFRNSEETKLLICTVIFCLVFTASAKWRVELRAKIGQYRNRCFNTWYIYNVNMLFKIFWKNTKLCEKYCQTQWSQAVLSGGSSPPTTLQKPDKYGRESSVSEMRIWFVSAWGVRRQGMGSTND